MTDAMTWVDLAYWIVIAGAAWRIDYLSRQLSMSENAVSEFELLAERLTRDEAAKLCRDGEP